MGFSVSELATVPLDDLLVAAQDDADPGSDTMNEIVRRFDALAGSIARSLTKRTDLHEDLQQAARIAVTAAVRNHERGRPGFAAYVRRYMIGAARREMAAWIGPAEAESPSEPSTWQQAAAMAAPSTPVGVYCWGYGRAGRVVATLPERQRELLTTVHIRDVSLTVIARETGTSVPAVSKRLAKCHRAVAAALAA